MSTPYRLTVRGARGSLPVAGPAFMRYGGNTTCLDLVLGEGERVVIDAGSGLKSLEAVWRAAGGGPSKWHLFFTHYHWDHVLGLPLFAPLHDPAGSFELHGFPFESVGLRSILERALQPPLFPVSLASVQSRCRYHDLDGSTVDVGPLRVKSCPLNHPQGAYAYRLEHAGRSVVFATDHECGVSSIDERLATFAQGASTLIADAQWTPEQAPAHRGWGHSSWRDALTLAKRAGVDRLVLFHHDPDRSDDQLDAIQTEAQREFPHVEVASEGLTIEL